MNISARVVGNQEEKCLSPMFVLFHIFETLTCFAIVHISREIDADKRNFFQATMTCSRFGLSFHQCQE